MTEDELFARRPMGMRMAMVVRQWRSIIDHAITDTGLTQSSWTVLMQLVGGAGLAAAWANNPTPRATSATAAALSPESNDTSSPLWEHSASCVASHARSRYHGKKQS